MERISAEARNDPMNPSCATPTIVNGTVLTVTCRPAFDLLKQYRDVQTDKPWTAFHTNEFLPNTASN